MESENLLHNDLKIVKELVYDKCDFELSNLKLNSEGIDYGACSFELNGQTVEHRVSKVTPKKTGQFVTVWKRNKNGVTEPYNITDKIDFIVITSKSEDNIGQFVFPQSVLVERGIISHNGKEGKRGIRVYPPWDTPTNKQAEKTQLWQTMYFVMVKNKNSLNPDLVKKIFERK